MAVEQEFTPIAPRTLKENVTQSLRQMIIEGTLAPGTELNQAQIAEKLGVSRGPIREALGKLELEGLISTVPYRGVVVTPLTPVYVEELYSIRALLETMALRRAIARITDADVDQLRQYLEEMRVSVQEGRAQALLAIDLQLHEYIMRMGDHSLAYQLWKQLEAGMLRCLYTQHRIYQLLDDVIGDHPALVSAIEGRDVQRAVELLHNHITESAERIVQHWPASFQTGEQPELQ